MSAHTARVPRWIYDSRGFRIAERLIGDMSIEQFLSTLEFPVSQFKDLIVLLRHLNGWYAVMR